MSRNAAGGHLQTDERRLLASVPEADKLAGIFGKWRTGDMPTIYGIKNCDTMKKARAWLDGRKVDYTFHDYKVSGIDKGKLEGWVKKAGWETLLNKAGTTFRKLPDADKENLTEAKAIRLMLAQPSIIKRPVLEHGGQLLVGFKPESYTAAFK
jgi:arsenate reductase